ncbi:MAG: hypothetical protein J6C37_12315 [Roseburia sp.]|nr:hypothetical protein [Roseburia sp.]
MEQFGIRIVEQGKDRGAFQGGVVLYPLFRRLEQVALLKSNTLHERLNRQNVVLRAVCRLRHRNASCRTEFVGTADRGFLTGKETVNVITEKDDFSGRVPDLSDLGEHVV